MSSATGTLAPTRDETTAGYSVVGQRLPRLDGLPHVLGQTQFTDDLSFPGMLYARAVLSRHHHARILNVDTSRARRLPGVAAIITAEDVPDNRYGLTVKDQPVIADDKVRHLGDVVAFVAACDQDTAEEAADLVSVEYEELPAVFDPQEALEPQAPLIHEWGNLVPFNALKRVQVRFGDVDEGFRKSDLVLEETYRTQAQEHAHLEPHVAVAVADANGRLTIWTPIQLPFTRGAEIAAILRMPLSRVRLICPPIGGGFGGKNDVTMEPHIALLALKTGRPVKCLWTRAEEFLSSSVRHPMVMTHRLGVKRDGTILARKVDALGDAGPYTNQSPAVLTLHCVFSCGPYRVPNVWVDGRLAYTNNQISGALRGYGVAQALFAVESQVDTAAHELGIDPWEFRMRNALEDGDAIPTGQRLRAVGLKQCLQRVAEVAGWPAAATQR